MYPLDDNLHDGRVNNFVSVFRNTLRDGSGDYRGFLALVEHPFIQVVGETPREAMRDLAEAHRTVADALDSLANKTEDTDV